MDNEEFDELHHKQNKKLNSGEIIECCCQPHSDKGKKCTHAYSPDENDKNLPPRCHKKTHTDKGKQCTHTHSPDKNDENLPPRCHKKIYKSLLSVDTDTNTDNNNNNVNGTTPAPLTSLSSSLSGTGFNTSFDFNGAYTYLNQSFAGPSTL